MDPSLIKSYNILYTLFLVSPIFWGVYEFRKFREQLNDIYKIAENINVKLDDISKNDLEKYPFLQDMKVLLDKINKVFNPKN